MHFKISRRSQLISALFVLGIVAGLAGLVLAQGPARVSADDADVTFTKWVTDTDFPTFPWDMDGVVGGDTGTGTFTGEVLDQVTQGNTTIIHALYHFEGSKHSFTADLFITKNESTGRGDVTLGVITSGWKKRSRVTGGWDTVAPNCDIATPGNVITPAGSPGVCFKGTLQIGPF